MRQILAGNGPVFNPGERVEADTSALWTWLLALLTWDTGWTSTRSSSGRGCCSRRSACCSPCSAPASCTAGTRRTRCCCRWRARRGRVAALLGLRHLGLEDSLVFCWLGLCWWLLAGLRPDSRRRAAGWRSSPGLAGSCARIWRSAPWGFSRPCGTSRVPRATPGGAGGDRRSPATGVPGVPDGLLRPAGAQHGRREGRFEHALPSGIRLLADFASPYHLWIPLLVLLLLFLLTAQHLSRADAVRCAAAVGSGLLMALYVIAIGGDFMHARMLLPPTFALLLPVMLVPVPVPKLSGGLTQASLLMLAAAIGVWAMGAGLRWRDPTPPGAVPESGIAAERQTGRFSHTSSTRTTRRSTCWRAWAP